MSTHKEENIRFAYWVPNVSGGLVVSKIEQRTSWEIDYNRKLAQIAERSGFDYALSQIRFTAGYGAEYQHEPVLFSHALLAATERLKLIVALLPGPWNPAVAAKQLATLDQLTGDRFAQVTRGICDTPTAIMDNPSPAAVAAVIAGIERAGRRPVLLAEFAGELAPYGGNPREVVNLLTTQEAHELTTAPERTWNIHYTVWMSTPTGILPIRGDSTR